MKKFYFHKLLEYFSNKNHLTETTVFHGSKFNFDSFSTDKEYTGVGAQGYGWGLYFTDSKNMAKSFVGTTHDSEVTYATIDKVEVSKEVCDILTKGFKSWGNKPSILIPLLKSKSDMLLSSGKISKEEFTLISNAKKLIIDTTRFIYTVSLPDTALFLDWQTSLQDENIKKITSQMSKEDYQGPLIFREGEMFKRNKKLNTGRDIYYALSEESTQRYASMFLSRAGICGIRYNESGATNYVIFNTKDIKIIKKQSF